MHPNPVFRGTPEDRNIAFARNRGFGTLAVNGEAAPLMAHVPFLVNDDASAVDLHLVRSNPIARLGAAPAIISVIGPDGYVSPDWYGVDDQVPTWNYVAVHMRGQFEPLPPGAIRDLLERQSADFEARLLPKPPWTLDKMSDGVAEKMMRMILPFRLHVASIDGTWKLSQNKDDAVRLRAADQLETGAGSELAALADLMRQPPAK